MVSGSQSLSHQLLQRMKLMSSAGSWAFQTLYTTALWETWGELIA